MRIAFVVSALRVIVRVILTVMAKSVLGAPLIIAGLLSLATLFQLWFKGGCTPTVLYVLIEPVFCTIFWCCLIFASNTNLSCNELGETFCGGINSQNLLDLDLVRRPHPWWVALVIPGLLFDLAFLYVFRKPVVIIEILPQAILMEPIDGHKRTRHEKTGGIGGLGLNHHLPEEHSREHSREIHHNPITGINRPASALSDRSKSSPKNHEP